MLLADGLTSSSAAGMEAAEKLDQALELTRRARDERELEDAAVLLAESIGLIGIPAFCRRDLARRQPLHQREQEPRCDMRHPLCNQWRPHGA